MKRLLFLPLIFITSIVCAGTPIYSTKVDRSLSDALDATGKWKRIFVATGQEAQVLIDLGAADLRLKVGTSTYGKSRYTIDIDGAAKSTSGTTSTVLLYTAPLIAGGTMGVDGVLAITSKWSLAGTTTSYIYIPQFKINNTTIWYRNLSPNDTPPERSDCYYTLINRGSTTSQVGNSDKAQAFAQSSYPFQTFTFNTSQDMTFTASASGNAAQTITLESIIIEVLNP